MRRGELYRASETSDRCESSSEAREGPWEEVYRVAWLGKFWLTRGEMSRLELLLSTHILFASPLRALRRVTWPGKLTNIVPSTSEPYSCNSIASVHRPTGSIDHF
jgi:hypothetical protein